MATHLHMVRTVSIAAFAALLGCAADRTGLAPTFDASSADSSSADAGQREDAGQTDASRDDCPDDPAKDSPGVCGCGVPDTDTDGDEAPDCIDECPVDGAKTLLGVCGCGVPDVDSDEDGFLACRECDDADENRRPDASELCNSIDDDCDAETDEGLSCDVGCADGSREGFLDLVSFPRVAACAGGWSVPGIVPAPATACGRTAGDDSPNPNGTGCSAEDLCDEGWHVCASVDELSAVLSSCDLLTTPDAFFIAAVSGPGGRACSDDGRTNDVFGCGTIGRDMVQSSCGPLNRYDSGPCTPLAPPWNCGASSSGTEASIVFKSGPERGGVLCCR
jgi:hypothetical protein